ncbi:MAG: 4-(cytidine 5'-diphospho)-2-C-methyl-D-erythritol kinase [Ruminococcaceae bacterium]|nr:4-(cytidine 5'-diphospho)-2-C-methyl-D-erythritol kinase [Oscillospiraceae bacterium]
MLRIWWCVYLVPALMLLCAAWGYLMPRRRLYPSPRPLTAERQRFADGQLRRMLWQFALAFAALGLLVMGSVRRLPSGAQRPIAYAVMLLQAVGAAAMVIPIERAIRERFGDAPAEQTVTERASAKVNLLLAVGEQRPDGYHELVSVMQTVDVCDTLTVRAHTGGGLELTCSNPDLPTDESNLAYRAAVKFFSYTGIENDGVSIELQKLLPMQAGLGGGSADAAAVLRALRQLYAPELPWEELESLAADLGSDVPFCVRGGTVLIRGRGERLAPLVPLPPCWFVLVKPPVSFSTRTMYELIDRHRCYDTSGADDMVTALSAGDLPAVCAAMTNTFQRVLPPDSEIFAIRARLLSLGALGAMLSGSGSAVFGIFADEESARMACAALRGTWPETFCGRSLPGRQAFSHV